PKRCASPSRCSPKVRVRRAKSPGPRSFTPIESFMSTVVLASGNKKKLAELQRILAEKGVNFVPQTELGVSEADETGLTFVENAIIKARHAAEVTGLPAIS